MNLIEILNNSILLEAVRINNGKEAFELIKSNKLGVKLDPSYKTVDESIIPYLDKVVNEIGVNDAPFAIQLLANKVPVNYLSEVSKSDAFKEIVSCKNKPWTKTIPGYKEVIDFSSKEKYDFERWHNLEKTLQEEGQKHGKKNKGSGNSEDVKELYNDGTWTLQVPTSWNGAKAASFYGKKGDKQIPTEWCTRAEKGNYDGYTDRNTKPLYIIRNMETGKAYQMAIRDERVDFLDQNDKKGDKIAKGDFADIPDNLLKKIPYGDNESMLDFKQAVENAKNELKEYKKIKSNKKEEEQLIKRGYFKDISNTPGSARWGKTEKVTDEISKNIFLNFADKSQPEMETNPLDVKGYNSSYFPKNIKDYNKNNNGWNTSLISGNKKVLGKFTKHNGMYAAKYYYNNTPNYFIMVELENDKDVRKKDIEQRSYPDGILRDAQPATNYGIRFYINNDNKIREVKKKETFKYYEKNADKLIDVALNDFGREKTNDRYYKNGESSKISSSEWHFLNDTFKKYVIKYIEPILKDEIKGTGYEINVFLDDRPNAAFGGILPKEASFFLTKNGSLSALSINIKKDPNKMKYSYKNMKDFSNIVKNEKTLKNKINEVVNKLMMDYSKEALKNKKIKYLRLNHRNPNNKENRLQFEETNYFPY